ncbi:uncharacterized protein SPSK_04673 [Sporothrix schenckii 1099-18]|uniref:Uncharacterized protein n=1 Tax=Sporothrix schenckii 1099-18 TaxID=1397361 RepID=A0A0F2M350_SPOSC|nr:uncharacterized protein SPSK_04673 [Sporothrix schenckii 1099-18]KJR83529.1 hypothetical protein SPSK_04673 [Sporothrix schenckii 1099-18]
MASSDGKIPLSALVGVGLGQPSNLTVRWLIFDAPALSATARTILVVAGAALLAIGASSDLFVKAALVTRRVNWRQVGNRIVHLSESSRWFFTVVNITRDVYKRW